MDQIVATNPVEKTKPYVDKNTVKMSNTILMSMNAGHYKTLDFRRVWAGEKCRTTDMTVQVKIPTSLLYPNMQSLYYVTETYYVPDQRVWENARKFYAGQYTPSAQTIPHISGYASLSKIRKNDNTDGYVNYFDTILFRDSWESSYIPRFYSGQLDMDSPSPIGRLPEYSVLPLRGFVAIYNDFLRDKRFMEEWQEYKGDDANSSETNRYFAGTRFAGTAIDGALIIKELMPRVKKLKSYLNDYTLELYNKNLVGLTVPSTGTGLKAYLANSYEDWMKKITLQDIEKDVQKNPWEIIAEQGGTRKITQGVVNMLSRTVTELNMQSVTQTVGDADNTEEQYAQLGQQGAYSYTNFTLKGIEKLTEYPEHGYVHTISYVVAQTGKSSRAGRHELNINYTDIYSPMLKEIKDDVLYRAEMGLDFIGQSPSTPIGYKRKFSEMLETNDKISGDFCIGAYRKLKSDTITGEDESLTSPEYAYTEKAGTKYERYDHTDIYLNRNMVIPVPVKEVYNHTTHTGDDPEEVLNGANQLLISARKTTITELPIDESLKNNYSGWGEV